MTNVQLDFEQIKKRPKTKVFTETWRVSVPEIKWRLKKKKKKKKKKEKKGPKIIQRSNDDHSQTIGHISSHPPQVSAPLHHWLGEHKKISIFDDAPHPFGIETNIAGCFDLTAQIDNQTSIMGHSMYSPVK